MTIGETPQRPETPIVDLAKLEWSNDRPEGLDKLGFRIPGFVPVYGKPRTADAQITYALSQVDIDGNAYHLVAMRSSIGTPEAPNEQYIFCLGKETGRVALHIDILPDASRQTARTDVGRVDADEVLKKGLGLEMYKTIFPFLQHLANTRQQPVDHLIEVDSRAEAKITPEKWEEIFLPILTAQGYVPSGKFFHDKTYVPESF